MLRRSDGRRCRELSLQILAFIWRVSENQVSIREANVCACKLIHYGVYSKHKTGQLGVILF